MASPLFALADRPSFPEHEKSLTPQQYYNYAFELNQLGKNDQSLQVCNEALKTDSNNAQILGLAASVYTAENNWEQSILFGQKALLDSPGLTEVYNTLYTAYSGKGDWTNAAVIAEKIVTLHPENKDAVRNLETSTRNVQTAFYSRIVVTILFILVPLFLFLLYKENSGRHKISSPLGSIGIVGLILIATAISCIFYLLFFHFATAIRGGNLKVSPDEIIIFLRYYIYQRDGMESYFLYAFTIAIVLINLAVVRIVYPGGNKLHPYLILVPASLLACLYLYNIGFYPPWNEVNAHFYESFLPIICVLVITAALLLLNRYSFKITFFVVAILLIPICFIDSMPREIDYPFILAPSLRLSQGAGISEIYFQYDILLSLLGWIWVKTGLDIHAYQIFLQIISYFFFLAIFLFTRKVFINKNLGVLFIVLLIIVRFYCGITDLTSVPQVTPLRLDLWLILLALVYWRGPYNWLLGLALGLLLLLHKNFGLIYTAAYAELLVVLFCVSVVTDTESNILKRVLRVLKQQLSLSLKNILIIAAAIAVSLILNKGFVPDSLKLYVKLGIGMIPISSTSFYWYIPILLGTLAALLVKVRTRLTTNYFVSGVFIILLAIGNSLYFFGRSHENNIINISTIFIFAFFILLDILDRIKPEPVENAVSPTEVATAKKKLKKTVGKSAGKPRHIPLYTMVIPLCVIAVTVFYYGNRISNRAGTQITNLTNGNWTYHYNDAAIDFDAIKSITKGSSQVYFLDFFNDFVYYYYGHYPMVGYFNPCASWAYKKDFAAFLQQLLNNHYYVVVTDFGPVDEMLPLLSYNHMVEKNGFTALSLEHESASLSTDSNNVFHTIIKDRIAARGLIAKPIKLGSQFTIRCVVNADSLQNKNATVLINLNQSRGTHGFSLQQYGEQNNQYLLFFGDNKQWIGSPIFTLQPNQWNYLAISLDKTTLKIYLNGKLVSTTQVAGTFVNSESPMIIGNINMHDRAFKGYIKEVAIDNEVIDEKLIVADWKNITDKVKN